MAARTSAIIRRAAATCAVAATMALALGAGVLGHDGLSARGGDGNWPASPSAQKVNNQK